jgi:hypothetical protein
MEVGDRRSRRTRVKDLTTDADNPALKEDPVEEITPQPVLIGPVSCRDQHIDHSRPGHWQAHSSGNLRRRTCSDGGAKLNLGMERRIEAGLEQLQNAPLG